MGGRLFVNSFFVRSWVRGGGRGVRALTTPRLQPSGVDALEGEVAAWLRLRRCGCVKKGEDR